MDVGFAAIGADRYDADGTGVVWHPAATLGTDCGGAVGLCECGVEPVVDTRMARGGVHSGMVCGGVRGDSDSRGDIVERETSPPPPKEGLNKKVRLISWVLTMRAASSPNGKIE